MCFKDTGFQGGSFGEFIDLLKNEWSDFFTFDPWPPEDRYTLSFNYSFKLPENR